MPWAFAFYAFLCHVAVHEEYHRPARAGGVGTESAVIVAGGDALFNSPGDRLLIRLCNGRGICEACYASACCGLALVTPEEGHELRSRYAVVGTEGAVSKAGGDAILDSPGNVSNWVNIVIIQKALVMRQKIGVESEFLDSQVQISTPNQKKPNTYSCCLYNGIMYAN